ncbi:trypsin inhibitor ClTI-1-like [Podarcis raffonei]|uniref:trypsin inhibitor ClTI-1-like n=1 Tax=Podarcis raffonei TaxID=65483 RepID=UPI002329333B|nr:trypsin inhibitor ClTI-1-like [Podarcis raffonei]
MKITSIFLLLAVGIFCSSGNAEPDGGNGEAREPACELYETPGCPRNFDPVCGTDQVTYPNECTLCSTNQQKNVQVKIKKAGIC